MGRTSALIVLCTTFQTVSLVGQESRIGSIDCRKNEKRPVVSPSLCSAGYSEESFGINVGEAAAERTASFLSRRGCFCRRGVSVPTSATSMERRTAKLAAGCGTHGTCLGRREASLLTPNGSDKYPSFTAAMDNTDKNIPLKLYDPCLVTGKAGPFSAGLLAPDNAGKATGTLSVRNVDGPDVKRYKGPRVIETDVCDMPLAVFAADGKK